jgi:hypothetical protein
VAQRTFCDGCAEEIGVMPRASFRVSVVVLEVGDGSRQRDLRKYFDLCSDCKDRLMKDADPRTWPRVVEAPTRKAG